MLSAGYVDFSDVYFDPSNGGSPAAAATLAHVALNSSGIATYTVSGGAATSVLAGEEAALSPAFALLPHLRVSS